MKKVLSVKEILIVLVSLVVITLTTTAFATDPLVVGNNNPTQIGAGEYENAQTPKEENNIVTGNNSTTGNNSATGNNSIKKYNTSNSNTKLPQTGIEDYNIGILLIVCVASAIFAYKKITDYKNV